jgi:hypothetical protein
MTAHLGILALMVAVAGAVLLRSRGRSHVGDRALVVLALAAALSEVALVAVQLGAGARWETSARRELVRRVDRIVALLRDEGASALAEVRAI